ncbi:MAG TPA: hypothetical protein VFE63_22195 [Roseiarcus sp.]|jgi:hypothetical protein|nr:hypothetical protein [Roseiarcus sp.]
MSPYDLTTLAALKAWLGLPSSAGPNDATLAALVTAASRSVYAALSRPALLPQSYTETLDLETRRVYPRQWPVLEVNSVLWRGIIVPPDQSSDLDASVGYVLQPGDAAPPGRPQAIDLFGDCYRPGRQSLVISYRAGYAVQGEAQTAPLSAPFQLIAVCPYGPWASDLGVIYAATGAALAPVAAAPGVGQYAVSGGVYSFSAGDAGQPVALSYGFIPQDVAQAALELAAERFRAAERIGLRSKSVGAQETIAYDMSAISAPVLAMLQLYKRVA